MAKKITALNVKCPRCLAKPGSDCKSERIPQSTFTSIGWGGATTERPHRERYHAARNTRIDVCQLTKNDVKWLKGHKKQWLKENPSMNSQAIDARLYPDLYGAEAIGRSNANMCADQKADPKDPMGYRQNVIDTAEEYRVNQFGALAAFTRRLYELDYPPKPPAPPAPVQPPKTHLTPLGAKALKSWLDENGRPNYHREGDSDQEFESAAGLTPGNACRAWRALRDGEIEGWTAVDKYGYYWLQMVVSPKLPDKLPQSWEFKRPIGTTPAPEPQDAPVTVQKGQPLTNGHPIPPAPPTPLSRQQMLEQVIGVGARLQNISFEAFDGEDLLDMAEDLSEVADTLERMAMEKEGK
jgi:hypothetical protein